MVEAGNPCITLFVLLHDAGQQMYRDSSNKPKERGSQVPSLPFSVLVHQ